MKCKLRDENLQITVNHWTSKTKKQSFILSSYDKVLDSDNEKYINDVRICGYDTVKSIYYKLHSIIEKSKADTKSYMWIKRESTFIDINNFVSKLFDSDINNIGMVNVSKLNTYYSNNFEPSYSFDTNKDFYRKDEITSLLLKIEELHVLLPLGFSIQSDYMGNDVKFATNPLVSSLNTTLTNDDVLNVVSQENMLLSDLYCSEINIITEGDFKDSIYDIYFNIFKVNYEGTTNETLLQFQKEVEKLNYKSLVKEPKCILHKVQLTSIPLEKGVKLNLNDVYNYYDSVENVPVVLFKSQNGILSKTSLSEVKILNYKLLNTINKHIKSIYSKDKASNYSVRKNTSIMFYVSLDEMNLAIIILKDNGLYDMYLNLSNNNKISIDDVLSFMQKKLTFLKDINDTIYVPKSNDSLFNNSNIVLNKFMMKNSIFISGNKDKLNSINKIKKQLTRVPNVFSNMVRTGGQLSCRFKLTSNYIESNDITLFVNDNLSESMDVIIEKIMSNYNKTKEEAVDEYMNAKMQLENSNSKSYNNKILESMYNSGVMLELSHNDEDIMININNIKYESTLKLVFKFIIYALLNDNNSKDMEDKLKNLVTDNNKVTEELLSKNILDTKSEDGDIDNDNGNDDMEDDEVELDADDLFGDDEVELDTDDLFGDDELESTNKVENANKKITIDVNDTDNVKADGESDAQFKKRRRKKFILDVLHNQDPELFSYSSENKLKTYPRACQTEKQPVLVTKSELDKIDADHKGSYTTHVNTGSSPTLKKKNYFICPRYWCPISRVSLTEEQMSKVGCPMKESVITLHEQSTPRMPYFLKEQTHPKGKDYLLPCCGEKAMKEEVKDSKYIHKYDTLVSMDRYVALPTKLHTLMNDNLKCIANTKNPKCFVRKGMEQDDPNLMETVFNTFLENGEDLKKLIKKKLKPEHFIFIKNGYNVKAFFDPSSNLKDDKNAFFNWLRESKYYTKMMNIDVDELLKQDLNNPKLIREYIVFNAYTNYMKYMESDIQKEYDDLASLLHFNWFNPNNIIVLLITFNSKDNILYITIPTNYDVIEKRDSRTKFGYIFKMKKLFDNIFEPIVKLDDNNTTYNNEINTIILNNISDIQNKNNNDDVNSELEQSIIVRYDIKYYVIDNNFRCCGVVISNNVFIPFRDYYTVSYDEVKDFIYLDSVNSLKTKESYNDIKDIYDILGVEYTLTDDYFGFKNIDFIYLSKGPFEEFSLMSLIELQNQNDDESNNYLHVVKKLLDDDKIKYTLQEQLYYLRHELNPLNDSDKIAFLQEEYNIRRIDANALLRLNKKYINYLINLSSNDNDMISLDLHAVESDKLLELYSRNNNPYINFTQSFSDYLNINSKKINLSLITHDSVVIKHKILNSSDAMEKIVPSKVIPAFMSLKDKLDALVPKKYSEDWLYSYFVEISKLLNKRTSIDKIKLRIKKEVSKIYRMDKEELLATLKMNPYTKKKNLESFTETKIEEMMNTEEYNVSILELEILSAYLNINIVIVGRESGILIDGLYFINANSDYYVILNDRKKQKENNFYCPVVKSNDGINTYLFHISELPKKLKKKIENEDE